jgi:hypothetical protein
VVRGAGVAATGSHAYTQWGTALAPLEQRVLTASAAAAAAALPPLPAGAGALSDTQRALSVTQRALSVTQRALSDTQEAESSTDACRVALACCEWAAAAAGGGGVATHAALLPCVLHALLDDALSLEPLAAAAESPAVASERLRSHAAGAASGMVPTLIRCAFAPSSPNIPRRRMGSSAVRFLPEARDATMRCGWPRALNPPRPICVSGVV